MPNLRFPLQSINTIGMWCFKAFQGLLNWTPWSRKALVSMTAIRLIAAFISNFFFVIHVHIRVKNNPFKLVNASLMNIHTLPGVLKVITCYSIVKYPAKMCQFTCIRMTNLNVSFSRHIFSLFLGLTRKYKDIYLISSNIQVNSCYNVPLVSFIKTNKSIISDH